MSLEDAELTRKVVARHLKWQGRSRFINKNTRNSRRISYLHRMFDDALFIHLIRDPRATAASIIQTPWWPDLEIWSENNQTPREWAAQGKDPVALAGRLWVAEVQRILDDRRSLPVEQYMELYYEEFVGDLRTSLERTLEFCRLRWSSQFESSLDIFEIRNMNYKFREQLSLEQVAIVKDTVGPLATSLGYNLD